MGLFHSDCRSNLTNTKCKYSGKQLGAEPTLPYLNPELTGKKLLVGANFASAGIGILNDTGIQFVSFCVFGCLFCWFFFFIRSMFT